MEQHTLAGHAGFALIFIQKMPAGEYFLATNMKQ